ncbi:MAG TPA: hypothetical protein PLX59_00820 [Candidatus Cloacimonadota bacterium]|nr:hypothetical protein [Candidatus Cloacimonadota bacterium]
MKRTCFIILALVLACASLTAQSYEDLIFGTTSQPDSANSSFQPVQNDDLIKVNYQRKDAHKAMLFSMILPGAGQFYADKSMIRTYIYPVVELALIGGILYFNHEGDKKVDDYEYYANGETITQQIGDYSYTGPRYRREYQNNVQAILIAHSSVDVYDGTFFRLDNNDTQHFYEDIGKYNKYIFGWADWYHTFAADEGAIVLDLPEYSDAFVLSGEGIDARWLGNHTIANINAGNMNAMVPASSLANSKMRKEYISMRQDAETEYSSARLVSLGLVANHLVSAIDAALVTSNRNRMSLSQSPFQMNYYTALIEDRITPTFNLSYRF